MARSRDSPVAAGTYIFNQQRKATLFTLGGDDRARSLAVDPYGLVYELGYFGTVTRYDETGNPANGTNYSGVYKVRVCWR